MIHPTARKLQVVPGHRLSKLNEYEKFRLNEYLLEINETVSSAPIQVKETYQKLLDQLKEVGISTPSSRSNFLTFWLGVEFQNIFLEVLSGELERKRYLQFICTSIENLVKFSFDDESEASWALSSVMKEMAEESIRTKKNLSLEK